jgi:hypothetical protein
MRKRMTTVTTLLGGVLLAAASTQANVGLPTSPLSYAVFGLDDVMIGEASQVEVGDVGCNLQLGAVWLKGRSRVAGAVAGDNVRLGNKAKAGRLLCNVLEGTDGTTSCETLTLPLVAPVMLPTVNVVPGGKDVKLNRRSRQQGLPPGEYGKIRVGSRSRLSLTGGTYDVRSIEVNRNGQLLCEAPCTINVDDRAVFHELSRLGPLGSLAATAVRVNVEGGGNQAAFRAEGRSTIDAIVYAPEGRIHLGTAGRFTGAFIGKIVEVMGRARVRGVPVP